MLYVLIALIVIALILIFVAVSYTTITLHYKERKLTIHIKNFLYKKKFNIDMGDMDIKVEEKTSSINITNDKKKRFDLKQKFYEAKNRVFNTEKGFSMDGLQSVKEEFCEEYSDIAEKIKMFLIKFRHKMYIPLIKIRLNYGTDNPAATGMVYGWIWGMIGTLYPLATRYFRVEYPQVDITPDFYGKRFDIELKSIIKVRVAHIIIAALPALWNPMLTYLKNNKNKGREKNGR